MRLAGRMKCGFYPLPPTEAEAIRSKEGIPLLKPVVDDLLDIAKKTGVPFKAKP